MKIILHGAAREVTGSCHELRIETDSGTKRILLDCGLFQGKRSEAAVKNAEFPFDPATDIDAVVLTHAHMDHAGRIPLLYKSGYRNKVICTYATKDLSEVMLMDSGYIHEKDEEYFQKHLKGSMINFDGPLYTQQDAIDCMEIFQGRNYNDWFDVCEGVKVQFIEAGHIVGAAMLVFEILEKGKLHRVGFTGDLGRNMLPIIRDPAQMPPVDTLICESTYGNRAHDDIATAKGCLKEMIIKTAKRGGKVMIPAFSLERTQEIVYDLHVLWDSKEIPAIPIYIDSPLATRVTEVFMKHPECYDKELYENFLAKAHNPFKFSLVKYTGSVEESKKLNTMPGPMVIMAGAGMCEAGRIRHHLKNGIDDPKNTVLAVGYMAENTLGRRIVDPEIHEVKIFDEIFQKKAEVVSVNAYSGHADMSDLDNLVMNVKDVKKIILVHGESEGMEPFATRIKNAREGVEIVMPEREEEIEI
ncbi:MAG: MBL fold metallo-hydrolase [Candidatus Peribacteraceae bacterium]|jgi:metallo-beta-lactamase family protein|nr:MBL fold metallo-hydrolase [Candidatus Peribacteraceae bacterium]HCI04223.1 MBL fold metallo-hydrolase [Candidatus Peribacteria bacterium]|tara:strand:+ start:4587 stop:5999 length:1413 start_codon:yes stop_codon:yes gene_type:complete